jgi:hypothetical protein
METKMMDRITWKAVWHITKFKDPTDIIAKKLQAGLSTAQAKLQFAKDYLGSETIENNCCLNEGIGELLDLIAGLGNPTKYDNANAKLGVGDSSTAAIATQTGLQASTNKTFKAADATWPQRTNQTIEYRATFASGDANYSWQEYTIVNATDDTGKNLNRKCADKGTKVVGESWVLDLQITLA